MSTTKPPRLSSTANRNSAYTRHLQKCLQYVHFYGGTVPTLSAGKTERQILEQEFEFIRSADDDVNKGENDDEKEVARKYYDHLYREFALVDLTRWRDGQIGLRWRTKQEVLSGTGHFTCASLYCTCHNPVNFSIDNDEEEVVLESVEMNFGYVEKGIEKNALVKVRVCERCVKKLRKVEREKRRMNKTDEGNKSDRGDGRNGKHRRRSRSRPPKDARAHKYRHNRYSRSRSRSRSRSPRSAKEKDRHRAREHAHSSRRRDEIRD